MSIINEIAIFEYPNEHDLEHDLRMKKNFSNPNIYMAGGDLTKRWYVYFSFRNPRTGKLQRMRNIYGKSNSFKTKEDRLSVLAMYRKKLLQLLKLGYNPFEDNATLLEKRKVTKEKQLQKEGKLVEKQERKKMPIREAFEFGLKLKEKLLSPTTKRAYDNRIKNFIKWLEKNHSELKSIEDLQKKDVVEFLNEVLSNTSARNRNNTRVDLSSIFQVLEDNEIIPLNFIKKINVLATIPERNKTYTKETQEEIFKYLQEKDPVLLLYIKFISYNFLRPIEVNRLQVGDINLTNKSIQFKAKNKPVKTKIIPELLIKELPDLSKLKKKDVLFNLDQIGGQWETAVENRRDYYTKRFKKVVKDHFDLGKDYGLYSFRHTYITKLFREFLKNSTPTEAEGKLMLITGHSTVTALRKYLRDIDAQLPEDYSAMLT